MNWALVLTLVTIFLTSLKINYGICKDLDTCCVEYKKSGTNLEKTILESVCNHIKENGKLKGIFIDSINGYFDHLHCLMLLNADTSISKQMQLIKGESSFWINKNKIVRGR